MHSRRSVFGAMAGLGAGLLLARAAEAKPAGSRGEVGSQPRGAEPAGSPVARKILTVDLSESVISGTGSGGSGSVTATASGGTGPYVYQWRKVSGTPYIEATDPTSSTTEFYWIGPFSGPPRLSGWVCDVTDATMAGASSAVLHVAFDPTA